MYSQTNIHITFWGGGGWGGLLSIHLCPLNCVHRQIYALPLEMVVGVYSISVSISFLIACTDKYTHYLWGGGGWRVYCISPSVSFLNCVHRQISASLFRSVGGWEVCAISISLKIVFANKYTDICSVIGSLALHGLIS